MAKRAGRASGPTARAREMAGMVRACDRSGLSQTAFARRRGIAPGTLGWWRHRLRGRGAPGDRPARFVEVVAVPSAPPIVPGRFEIVLPGGRHRPRARKLRRRGVAAGARGPGGAVLSLPPAVRIFVAREPTDLRKSFDTLAALVPTVLAQDAFSGHLFCFFNRRADRVKLLVWDRTGFWLFYKRLEAGRFSIPGAGAGPRVEWTARELFLVLEGIELGAVRQRRRYGRPASAEA